MTKKKKYILIITNFLCICMLLAAFFIPEDEKTEMIDNIDISNYNGISDIPTAGIITDKRKMEISFDVTEERLYGVCLYFCVKNDENDQSGEIVYSFSKDGEEIQTGNITLKELFAKMGKKDLKGTEILLNDTAIQSGRYTLVLNGNNIPKETKVSFYANEDMYRYVTVKHEGRNYYGILYTVEVLRPTHPHIWFALFVEIVCILFTYLGCNNYRSKEREKSSDK